MTSIRFRSRIEINNINPYVLIQAKHAMRLQKGWRTPMPVRIRVNGKPELAWCINLMPKGNGAFYLYLRGDVRTASGTEVGDQVTIEVQFDHDYRGGPMHPMPSWFAKQLDRNRQASRGWDALIPSRQKEILRYFAGLKSTEAQQRNLRKALHVLAGRRGRFMARSWNESEQDAAWRARCKPEK